MVSLVMELNDTVELNLTRGHFSIFTTQFRVNVAFAEDGTHSQKNVVNNNELAICFLEPYENMAFDKKNITQREAFLRWLFGKVDLESFEMKHFNGFPEVCDAILYAMKDANARCFKMLMKHSYKFTSPYYRGNPWNFFPDFCRLQQQLKVPLELEINTDGPLCVLSTFLHVDIVNQLGGWFPKILCKFRSIWIFHLLFAICTRWLNNQFLGMDFENLDLIKFRLCFVYTEQDVDSLYEVVKQAHHILELDIELLNIDEEVFRNLMGFSSHPEEIIFKRMNTQDKLSFKITKVDNCAFIDSHIF